MCHSVSLSLCVLNVSVFITTSNYVDYQMINLSVILILAVTCSVTSIVTLSLSLSLHIRYLHPS
jgi:hypothetical protein